jgi:ArsR family transcriptional regulator
MSVALPTLPGPASAACCAPPAGANASLDAERLAAIAKALSEPVRVRIVDLLRRSDEPVCQCELNALFELKQPVLSHHMKRLADAGLVTVTRRHRWAYYAVAPEVLKELSSWLT